MEPADIPYLPRGVRLHYDKVREVWVLLAPERAVKLDMIGHAILSEVNGSSSFDAITRLLAKKYGAPLEQIIEDSASFLSTLRERRFLDVLT